MHHPNQAHAAAANTRRLVIFGLAWLLLGTAPAAVAADYSAELYEAAFCKSVGGNMPGASAFWQQRFKELSRQATSAAVKSADERALDDNLNFSVKDIERQKTLCDSKIKLEQETAKLPSKEQWDAERKKFYDDQEKLLSKLTDRVNASSAEKARCLVVTQVLQQYARQYPEILAPNNEPERQRQEMANVDDLVSLWQADFKRHIGPSNREKGQQFYTTEKARYGREWQEQKQNGNPQLTKFMTDNAVICRDKMRVILKKAKQR